MPSKVHERVQSVQTQQTGRQPVLLRNAVALSLTSIKAVVAARETSGKSRDFKAADAIQDDLKAQSAQQEDVQQAPIAK